MKKTRFATRLMLVVAVPAVAACADDTGGAPDGGSTGPGVSGVTLDNGNDSTTGVDTTTGDDDDDVLDTTAGSSTTGVPNLCEAILCGSPAVCCQDDEDCVLGDCVDACPDARCGANLDVCCDVGDVCLNPNCVTPTGDCVDSFDCQNGEFCEPTLGQCLPQQDPVACELIPEFEQVEVEIEWALRGAPRTYDTTPDACDPDVDANCDVVGSLSVPLVGDVDGDGKPEVILNTWNSTDPNGATNGNGFIGHIIVLDGQNGEIQVRVQEDLDNGHFGSYGRSTPALALIDANPPPDIVYAGRPRTGVSPWPNNTSLIHAVDGLGQTLWSSHTPAGDDHRVYVRNGAISVGNWDSDEQSELVIGTVVIDNDGTVVFDQPHPSGLGGGVYGSSGNYRGGISAIADLTGDGIAEIISGREAWQVDWVEAVAGPPTVTLTRLWDEAITDLHLDGYPAVADLDMNGTPEVVIAGSGEVKILDGATGALWCGVDFDNGDGSDCVGNDGLRTQPVALSGETPRGGPPIIADFDGDGRPEIGVAADIAYTVFDIYREDEDIVQPGGAPPAQPGELYVRWANITQDGSSASTGASVFDFQGDGVAEVVYGDECYLRIYSGDDGAVILEIPNSNATVHEYPVIADIDGDGNSEMLVTANDYSAANCTDPGYTPRNGLFAYGDPNDQWLRTRQVWNSHTYHVTNSNSTGGYPQVELDNWTQDGLNNYRQNVQGVGVFNAPDLTVQLSIGTGNCLDDAFEVIAVVRNEGSIGIPAGIPVTLYEGVDTSGILVSEQLTANPLLPGAEESLSWLVAAPMGAPKDFFVTVDNDNGLPEGGTLLECNEDNQTSTATSVSCNTPG